MKRAGLLLLGLCACSLRAPRVQNAPCSSTSQCGRSAVCFLGECRGHSSALTLVAAEIRPANVSTLGVAQFSAIDLHLSAVHDFALAKQVVASGSVTQDGANPPGVENALVTFTDQAPAIPDRLQQVQARTGANGALSAQLPQGSWNVLVNPPSPQPPYRAAAPLQTSAPALNLVLPRFASLVAFQSALTADGGVLTGADVIAVDDAGFALSAPAAVQTDGGFALYLPPDTTTYYLQVGPPPSDLDGGVAAPSVASLPNYDHLLPTQPAVEVVLTPIATLQGKVLDGIGNPIAGARVYASSDQMQWSLSRSTTTLADGSYALSLRAGDYLVEAAPAASVDGPALSGEQRVTVPAAGSTLNLACPAKVHGNGLVVRPDGTHAGANFQITATRTADHLLLAGISQFTATDFAGAWSITADPGRYRVEVVPPPDTGLPRKVVQIELAAPAGGGAATLPVISISPPLLVGGTVCSPPGSLASNATVCLPGNPPVASATVSFYALDANGHSVLLGSAPTDAKGRYEVVLPDVAQPGVAASIR